MGLQIREFKGDEANQSWVDGGLNFGYGPVESAVFFNQKWEDPITKKNCDQTPAIVINSNIPIFSPLIAGTMKGILGICQVKSDDPILLLACQHASYIHRPGAIIVTNDAQSIVNLDEDELNVKINESLIQMGLDADKLFEKFGGIEGYFNKNTQYINGQKATVVVHKDESSLAIEKGLLVRYWLGKDVDVLIPDVTREGLPKIVRDFQRPDINIACQGEIFTGSRQANSDIRNDEIREIIEKGKLTTQKTQKRDILDNFIPSKNYFG